MFHALRPSRAPGFAYAWLELISHRLLMSKLLLNTPQQKVWYWYWNSLLRAGKANPWRRLSLLNKHYNNYWSPNAVALALERIHNPVEVLNQTARYKHYSKTYYLSPPPPPPTRVRQGGGPRPLGILVLPPILCRRLAFCYCGSYKKVWNVLCYYLSCSLVHVHSSFIAISLLDKTGVNKVHYGQGENG